MSSAPTEAKHAVSCLVPGCPVGVQCGTAELRKDLGR